MSIIQDALKKAANSNPSVIGSNPSIIAPEAKEKKRISRIFVFAPIALFVIVVVVFLMLNGQLLARNIQTVSKTPGTSPSSRQEADKKDAGAPQAPEARAVQKPKIVQAQKFQLNGIMCIESGSKAIVNGSVVSEGDLISGATVKKICGKEVILSYEDVDILLNMND